MAELEEGERSPTPPYIAFQSLKTLASDMKEHGLPGRIDRSVLTNFSGAVASQIMTAIKFLGLTTHDNKPTPLLSELVTAHATDKWPSVVARVLRDAYEPVFRLDLQSASPNQFAETFRKAYPAKDEVLRKCITFFLNAARESDIAISPYIMKNKKPRSGPSKKRTAKPNGGSSAGAGERSGNEIVDEKPPARTVLPHSRLDVLMKEIYDPKGMDKEEEQAVFTLMRYLRKQGA